MAESLIFELKLEIHQLQEKIKFLSGCTNGSQLVDMLMEKDDELKEQRNTIENHQAKNLQLFEHAKRLDAKRKEMSRQSEHQTKRINALEEELNRQLEAVEALRAQVSDGRNAAKEKEQQLKSLEVEMESFKDKGAQALAAAKSEASNLQTLIERQREQIILLEEGKEDLEKEVESKNRSLEDLERRKKDTAARARELKHDLESRLGASLHQVADLKGKCSSLGAKVEQLRKRQEERALAAVEQERKATALAMENGSLKTRLASELQELESMISQAEIKDKEKAEADTLLMERDSEIIKLQRKYDNFKQEMDRRLHRAKEEAKAVQEELRKERHDRKQSDEVHQERYAEVEQELLGQEEIVASQKKLAEAAQADNRLLKAEASSKREEEAERAHQADTALKVEIKRRARMESGLAEAKEELRRMRSEVERSRHLGAEVARLAGENNELKDRIQRQEKFQMRKLAQEKEKKKRGLNGRASTSGVSGGKLHGHMAPLPPTPSSTLTLSPSMDSTTRTFPGTNASYSAPLSSTSGGDSGAGGADATTVPPPRRPRSRSLSCSSPIDDALDSGKENGCQGGRALTKQKSFSSPSTLLKLGSLDGGGEWAVGGDGGAGGCGDNQGRGRDRGRGSEGDWVTPRSDSGSGGLEGRGLVDRGVAGRGGSVGRGEAAKVLGGNKRLESKAINRVGRASLSRSGSKGSGGAVTRGRAPVAAKVAAPRSSSVGLQARAASGWR